MGRIVDIHKQRRFIQIWNPKGWWVLVDRKLGQIIDFNEKPLPRIFKISKNTQGFRKISQILSKNKY